MSDDEEQRPLFDPRLFAPTELLAEDVDHTVDVAGDTTVEVTHTVEFDADPPVRRVEAGVVAFAALVVAFGLLTPVGVATQVSAAAGVVLAGNVLARAVGV